MSITNSSASYGHAAKSIHWVTVALLVTAYLSIYYRELIAKDNWENYVAVQLHFSAGISIFVLTLFRVVWTLFNEKPILEEITKWQKMAAVFVHKSLYFLLFLMPITGYLSITDFLSRSGGNLNYFLIVDVPFFKNIKFLESTGISLKEMVDTSGNIHSIMGSWVLLLLICVHVLAALYHHLVLRDKSLKKMIF